MKRIFLLLLIPFVGCNKNGSDEIDISDYKIYADYWYDKTIYESGPAVAVVDEDTYDFDVMGPNAEAAHRFKVRNTGKHPLTFIVGPKSCKCTKINIIDREIQPGKTGEIELVWKTVALASEFKHSGTVYTNDPNNRSIKFNVKGKVSRRLAMTPGAFRFDRVHPDSTESSTTVNMFSEEWDSFEIKDLKTSFGNEAKVELLPISEEEKKKHVRLKSGKTLKLTLKTPPVPGVIHGWVSMKVAGPDREVEHRIEVVGKVFRRLSLEETSTGTLTPDSVMQFGRVNSIQGKTLRFLLTVNDANKRLNISKVISEPGYVSVDLRPLNSKVDQHGTYVMEVSIPPGQKTANFNRQDSFGKLTIEFDHERVASFEFALDFYVIE